MEVSRLNLEVLVGALVMVGFIAFVILYNKVFKGKGDAGRDDYHYFEDDVNE